MQLDGQQQQEIRLPDDEELEELERQHAQQQNAQQQPAPQQAPNAAAQALTDAQLIRQLQQQLMSQVRTTRPQPLNKVYNKDIEWEEFIRYAKLHFKAYEIKSPKDVELLILALDADTSRHLHQRSHPVDPSTLTMEEIDAIMRVGPFLASKSQFHIRQQLRDMEFHGNDINSHIKKYNTLLAPCLTHQYPMSCIDQCDKFRETLPPSIQEKCFTTIGGQQWDNLQAFQEWTGQHVAAYVAQNPKGYAKWKTQKPCNQQPPVMLEKKQHG